MKKHTKNIVGFQFVFSNQFSKNQSSGYCWSAGSITHFGKLWRKNLQNVHEGLISYVKNLKISKMPKCGLEHVGYNP